MLSPDCDWNRWSLQTASAAAPADCLPASAAAPAESDLSGTLKSEYVFFDGERVARRDNPGTPNATVAYYFSDHLKTASVITDAAGNIKSESDYYPWGGELQFVANDSNHYKFTGKERDETGLDYFGARYYSNGMGRFITPDWSLAPVPVPYAILIDPQSLNQYTFTRNNPRTYLDSDGHSIWETVIKIYKAVKHERELVAVIRGENTASRAMKEVKQALNTIDKERYARVVEVEGNNKAARNALGQRLSSNGKSRPPESSPRYPEHINPQKGEYSDVHVQTEKAAREVGYLGLIGAAVAPYSQGESENPGASAASILSAALWDTAKAIDPIFLTDGIEWMVGLSPNGSSGGGRGGGNGGGGGGGGNSGGSRGGGGGWGQTSNCTTQMSNSKSHPC